MAFTWQNMATAIVLTFFCVIPFTTGLYFHIGETERKCFIEEIPDDLRQSFVSLGDASPVAEESPRQKNLKFG